MRRRKSAYLTRIHYKQPLERRQDPTEFAQLVGLIFRYIRYHQDTLEDSRQDTIDDQPYCRVVLAFWKNRLCG